MFDKRPLSSTEIPSIQIARILLKVGFVEKRFLDGKNPEVRITDGGLEAIKLLRKLVMEDESKR